MTEAIKQRLQSTSSRGLALALLATTQFVLILDIAIVTVALPSIGTDLDFAPADLSWVINAYALLFGGFLLLGGRMSDLIGRRRMFMAGLIIFTAASLAGALAQSALWLVIARGAQGLGAALVSPAALSLVMTLFPEGAERNKALGIWGAVAGSGGAAGAILGGVLTDVFSWQAVLYVNIPVGIAAVALAPRLLPEGRDIAGVRSFDLAGAVSVTAGLALLIYAVVDAPDAGWGSTQTLVLGRDRRSADRRLRGHRGLGQATAAATAHVPQRHAPLGQRRRRADDGGAVPDVVPADAVHAAGARLHAARGRARAAADRAADRGHGGAGAAARDPDRAAHPVRRRPRCSSPAACSGSRRCRPAARSSRTSSARRSWPAIGAALAFIAGTIAATTGAADEDAGLASGLLNTSQQVGGAIGIAAIAAIATAQTNDVARRPARRVPVALTEGYQTGYLVVAGVALAAAVVVAVLVPGRRIAVAPDATEAEAEAPPVQLAA